MNLLLLALSLIFGTITYTGEDDGNELFAISLPTAEYEYVTEAELQVFFSTGTIRGNSYSSKPIKPEYEIELVYQNIIKVHSE